MASTDFRTKTAVLSQFDAMDTPFFEVHEGKQKKFDYMLDDIAAAKEFLDTQLTAIESFGSTALFRITYYRELTDKGKFAADNISGSNTFKLNEPETAQMTGYWKDRNMKLSGVNELAEIKELLQQQQSQINSLLEDPDETEEEPEPEKNGLGALTGMLSGLLNQPEVQQAIAGKIVSFLDNLLPTKNIGVMQEPTSGTLGAIGGTQQDDILIVQQALDKLFAAGMTANDFKKLADLTNEPQNFNFYLAMLRK